jgi:hypothetical protein
MREVSLAQIEPEPFGRISIAFLCGLPVARDGRSRCGLPAPDLIKFFAAHLSGFAIGHGAGHLARQLQASRRLARAARETLILIWEASDRICGKRLQPLVPVLLEAMERHGHLRLAPEVRTGLLAISATPMDRVVREARA